MPPADLAVQEANHFLLRLQLPHPSFANIYFPEKPTQVPTAYDLT